jgi:hypothetical protein
MFNKTKWHNLLGILYGITLIACCSASSTASTVTNSIWISDNGQLNRDDLLFCINQQVEYPMWMADQATNAKRTQVNELMKQAGDKLAPFLTEIFNSYCGNKYVDNLVAILNISLELDGDFSELATAVRKQLEIRSSNRLFVSEAINFLGKFGDENDIDMISKNLSDFDSKIIYINDIRHNVMFILFKRGKPKHIYHIEKYIEHLKAKTKTDNTIEIKNARDVIAKIKVRELESQKNDDISDTQAKALEATIKTLKSKHPNAFKITAILSNSEKLQQLMYGKGGSKEAATSELRDRPSIGKSKGQ